MGRSLVSRNPHTGKVIQSYAPHDRHELDRRLDAVAVAQAGWRKLPVEARCEYLSRLGDVLRQRKDSLGALITREMGKPLSQSVGEIEKCAWVCDYYAAQSAGILEPIPVDTDAELSEVVFNPLGTVLAIMPWNFPFWQAFRFAAPAIAAGNGIVLKHASNVTGCALAIEEVCSAALPKNLVSTLLVSSEDVADLIQDARVNAVTFTGSTGAGAEVGKACGSAIKKCVLELGGSDPYIILADADIKLAAEQCAKARLVNSGQSCIAAKRFIVEAPVEQAFTEELRRILSETIVGDPEDAATEVGPLARPDLAATLADQVERSVAMGARVSLQQSDPEGDCYYPPTLLTEVTPDMPAFTEELFGPVAPVTVARNADHAINLANQSVFGLGGAIFSADRERAMAIAEHQLETGTVAINGMVASDPRLPFGGIRQSGFGRELGEFGPREFVNVKTVSRFA